MEDSNIYDTSGGVEPIGKVDNVNGNFETLEPIFGMVFHSEEDIKGLFEIVFIFGFLKQFLRVNINSNFKNKRTKKSI